MPKRAEVLSALEVGRIKTPGMHYIGEIPGLALQVTPSGMRSWVLRYAVGKKRREMGLGSYPGVTLAQAKERAREARDRLREGVDPIDARKQARSALLASQAKAVTFEQAAQRYIDTHGDKWRNPKHRAQWAATLETYAFPVMGRLLVADVGKEHVLEVLRPIWTKKAETASRLRGRIETVLSYAVQAGYRPEGLNPARWKGNLDLLLGGIPKAARVEHHRALDYRLLGEFMQRLRKAEGMGARALEFAILTAVRSGEVRGATWGEIDLPAATWTIPASRMKAGKEHRVPLSEQAIQLLQRLPRIEECPFVFPSTRAGELSDATLSAVLKRMDVDAVPHGFRSTFRDWAGETTAFPREVCEHALAHKLADGVEAAYQRGDLLDRRRQLMQTWADYCDRVGATGAVIPIRGAA